MKRNATLPFKPSEEVALLYFSAQIADGCIRHMSVKNYVYISDTKVNMFYDQIASSDVEKTGAEYGIDVKILKWAGKRETEKVITQMKKLERVVEFIKKSKKIGTLDEPSTYFTGMLNMRWGSLHDEMALFVGETSRTAVILGGSVRHIQGESSRGGAATSMLPAIFTVFKKHTDAELVHTHEYPDLSSTSPENDLQYAWNVAAHFHAPAQKLEFLARNYLLGRVGEKNVLLGTPFYVALAD
jgi:hypothetical protein